MSISLKRSSVIAAAVSLAGAAAANASIVTFYFTGHVTDSTINSLDHKTVSGTITFDTNAPLHSSQSNLKTYTDPASGFVSVSIGTASASTTDTQLLSVNTQHSSGTFTDAGKGTGSGALHIPDLFITLVLAEPKANFPGQALPSTFPHIDLSHSFGTITSTQRNNCTEVDFCITSLTPVTNIPVPASASLLGLTGLIAVRRRRR